jgi:adenosylmethionine-8-amino-7-oxononanoate aminotransferase
MIGETRELVEKDRRYVWHALSGYDPNASTMVVAEGDGAWITDTDGNRYLDGMSGLWCVNVGYGREELAQAAYEQLKEMPYYPLLKSHQPAIRLGEKLNEWLEDDYVFLFSNSGSEANEVAFKVARQYHEQNGEPGRYKFVSRYRAFHGQTLGARWRQPARPRGSTSTSLWSPASCTSSPRIGIGVTTAQRRTPAPWSVPGR